MPAKRILFITDKYPPQGGGVGVSAARLARGLATRGIIVHVLHVNADTTPGAVQSAREGELVVHRLGAIPDDPATALQLADHLITHLHERLSFTHIHGHNLYPGGYLAAFYARLLGIKSCVSIRGNDIDRGMFDPVQFSFIEWTLKNATAIGTVSRALAGKAEVLSERSDITFTPNSVDTEIFSPRQCDKTLLAEIDFKGETILGFVGELRAKKGTHFMLDAFRIVRADRPAKLLLIGSMRGADRMLLRLFLRDNPTLRPDIHVIPYTTDRALLCKYYNLLDLLLSPSLWDGMPNSVLEAMACGRVVLASDAGGIRDIITHGENGYLIGLHELARLGEGCLELLDAGNQTIGHAARAHMLTNFTPAAELDRQIALYG